MLTFAIATFFALALSGALLTIIAMFYAYRNKIETVIIAGLAHDIGRDDTCDDAYDPVIVPQNHAQPRRAFKAQQIKPRYFLCQPAPLPAAA